MVPPVGPAIPVVDIPMVVCALFLIPSAISCAVCLLTAPWVESVCCDTCSRFCLAWLL